MGSLPDLFDPSKGTSFQASGGPNAGQVQQAYGQSQIPLAAQQAYNQTLQNQAGQFGGGLANQQGVFNQQQALANQLQGISQGQGPNPAQSMLNQATGQNVSNQAALMAGQRGASANPALMARQIAQQGAGIQQNAIGQAATQQANQQLGALGQLSGVQGQMANLAGTQVGQQLAQQGQQQAGLQALQGATQGAVNPVLGMQQDVNKIQGGIASTVAGGQAKGVNDLFGGAMSGASSAAAMAQGGEVENPKLGATKKADRFPSHVAMPPHLKSMATLYHGQSYDNPEYQEQTKMAAGGDVKAYSGQTNSLNMGSSLKAGGKVPGQAKVAGDSETNDTVAAKLSPGEVVLPRSVMNSKDPVNAAAQFVAAELKKKKGGGDHQGDFKEALKRAVASRKSK